MHQQYSEADKLAASIVNAGVLVGVCAAAHSQDNRDASVGSSERSEADKLAAQVIEAGRVVGVCV